jgi:hypothetical protein
MNLANSPGLRALREEFASEAIRDARARRPEMGWTVEEAVDVVRSVAAFFALEVNDSIMASVAMALDVWATTEEDGPILREREDRGR